MSKDNKHTQGSPGDFEDKIDSAMAGLEADLDEEFHGADFYDEDDQESDFDSWEGEDDSLYMLHCPRFHCHQRQVSI